MKHSEVTTVFHIVTCSNVELNLSYMKELGTKNYVCISRKAYEASVSENLKTVFDDYLIMDTETDYSGFDDYFAKHLTDPSKTRLTAWSDDDIKICGVLREKYGIPGDNIEQTKIVDNKYELKQYLQKVGVKYADYVHIKDPKIEDFDEIIKTAEAKHGGYPMFGKPTNLAHSMCTAEIHNRENLRDFLIFTKKFPELEFLIEEFLVGEHYNFEAIIINGKIVFDMAMHYPHPLQLATLGKPLGNYMMPFDSIVYKQGHEILEKMVSVIPTLQNTAMFYEAVYKNGDLYVMEACKRKSGFPCQGLYYRCTGINFEEANVKLTIGRTDFYVPERLEFKRHVAFLMYIKNTGRVVGRRDFPPISGTIDKEFQFLKVGETSKLAEKNEMRDYSLCLYIANNTHEGLVADVLEMLKWEPFEYSKE